MFNSSFDGGQTVLIDRKLLGALADGWKLMSEMYAGTTYKIILMDFIIAHIYLSSHSEPTTFLWSTRFYSKLFSSFHRLYYTTQNYCYVGAGFTDATRIPITQLYCLNIDTYPAIQVQWVASTSPPSSTTTQGTNGVTLLLWEWLTYN